jgi:magnesium transporter
VHISRKKYLQYINPLEIIRTKKILQHNPTLEPVNNHEKTSILSLFRYNQKECTIKQSIAVTAITPSLFESSNNYWLNLDILNVKTIEQIGNNLALHPLIIEDILSTNQRPKIDEIDGYFTCVLQILYYNEEEKSIETEQVSFVLGEHFLISFQEDSYRDPFNAIREKLKSPISKVRQFDLDFLLYSFIDTIVDQYFIVLDKIAIQIEKLEEAITQNAPEVYTMNQINDLRKEIMLFKRSTFPVRELVSSIIRSENILIHERTNKYFKDVYDHVIQANDLCETYRDVIANLRDLYFSKVNVKMNEIMKFLAIVTALLAPATVLGGIFGMNFDRIPYLHDQNGFWIATGLMIIIPLLMLIYFRKKNWF